MITGIVITDCLITRTIAASVRFMNRWHGRSWRRINPLKRNSGEKIYDSRTHSSHQQIRPDLPLSSAVEVCFPAPSTPDEPLCGGTPCLLLRGAGFHEWRISFEVGDVPAIWSACRH